MIEQLELISSQQLGLLKELSKYQPVLQFQSLADIPLSSHEIKTKDDESIMKQKQQKQTQSHRQSKNNLTKSMSINNRNQQSNGMNKVESSISHLSMVKSIPQNHSLYQSISKSFPPILHQTSPKLHFLTRQLQKQTTPKYLHLKNRLLQYKQQSQRIYLVSQFINSYQQNFTLLNEQKEKLLEMLNDIKGQTTQLVEKQKSLIDMSMAVKEALDYYTYYSKNQFNYACEIASRQLFEDNLQPTLSTVMDAIEFFTQNETYVQSKKHLNFYLASKSKILSFIKSFFIKLLNKENSFIIKHIVQNQIDSQMNTLYPKSRLALVKSFLLTFPLVKKHINQIIKLAKQSSREQQSEQLNYLQLREMEIEQFMLSQSNIGLIKYLEKHNYQIYSEVMLNLFTFNRFNFHQNLIFYWNKRSNNSNLVNKTLNEKTDKTKVQQKQKQEKIQPRQPQKHKLHQFRSKTQFIIQIIIAEYLYIHLVCNPSTLAAVEFLTTWLYKLILKYMETIVRQIRELLLRYRVDPFQICATISVIVDHQLNGYLSNIAKEQYHSYIMGVLYGLIAGEDRSVPVMSVVTSSQRNASPHSTLIKQLFSNTIKSRLLNELSTYCHQNLPKLQLTTQKHLFQENINMLISYIPKLQYCPKQADSYLISSLDVLIKSIKQINLSIESRFQCYVWNLIAFGKLKAVLNAKKLQLVSKQIRLDFNESLNIIEKVKRLQRPQSLIKYAQDIFNVIKTGIPSLNQLTLDYNKYINEHYEELQSRFLKDILFIYAKNIIQFLQKVIDTKKRLGNSEKEIRSKKNLDERQEEHSPEFFTMTNGDKKTENTENCSTSPKSTKELQKSPKYDKQHSVNELTRLCEPQSMKSLYNGYLHSIEKYIKQSKQILQTVHECRIQNKQKQVRNINNLIREVYEKLFDFLDTFYITVSEINSEITLEFEEIAVIKQKQQALWMEKLVPKSVEKVVLQ